LDKNEDDHRQAAFGSRLLDLLSRDRLIPKWQLPRLIGVRLTIETFFLIVIIGALSGAVVLAIVNAAAAEVDAEERNIGLVLAFVVSLALYRWSRMFVTRRALAAIEDTLTQLRLQMTSKIASMRFEVFEAIPSETLVAAVSKNFDAISQQVAQILFGLQSLVQAVLILAYLCYISPATAATTAAIMGLVVLTYVNRSTELKLSSTQAGAAEATLLGVLDDLLRGAKEIRLSEVRKAQVLGELADVARKAEAARVVSGSVYSDIFVLTTSISYILAANVVFVMPLITDLVGKDPARIITTVLFLLTPVGSVAASVQPYLTARFAISNLRKAADELGGLTQSEMDILQMPAFESLELRDVVYEHATTSDDHRFVVGPVNFDVKRGEVVFITGANGSGKSTLIKVVTGLYKERHGRVLANGRHIDTDAARRGYQRLFGTVFSDFHLFRHAPTLPDDRAVLLRELIETMHLGDKLTTMEGDEIRTLSTGQKKRLALARMIAEGREIFVLDEWAADQDPHFRQLFYREWLPRLRDLGHTIIAVTHDDRYFDIANRRYHMDNGQLAQVA
jgi:putative ATP-binding cassette transporter